MWVTIARHGETTGNLSDALQGQLPGSLTARGRTQAQALAAVLRDRRFEVIVSSDLKRALDTARAIARQQLAPLAIDPLLRERHFGKYQGTNRTRFYAGERALADPVRNRPVGGESLADLYDRAARFVAHRLVPSGLRSVLIVSHGDMIRMLLGVLQGLSVERAAAIRQSNACLNVVRMSPTRSRVVTLNSVAHLEAVAQSTNRSDL